MESIIPLVKRCIQYEPGEYLRRFGNVLDLTDEDLYAVPIQGLQIKIKCYTHIFIFLFNLLYLIKSFCGQQRMQRMTSRRYILQEPLMYVYHEQKLPLGNVCTTGQIIRVQAFTAIYIQTNTPRRLLRIVCFVERLIKPLQLHALLLLLNSPSNHPHPLATSPAPADSQHAIHTVFRHTHPTL